MSAAETKKIVSVSDLKSDMDAALSKEYKQFILSDNCHSSVPDKLYDCTFTTKKDFSDKHLEIFENTLGISPIDEKYLREDDDYMGDGYVYDNSATKEYAAISDSGFVSFFSDEMYKVDFGAFPIKALYVNGDENWCGEKSEFDLNGADFSVEKAVDICDKWIAEKWQKYEPDFDFVPSHIFKLQNGDSQIMAVKTNKYQEGVKLSGCDMLNLEYDTPVYTQVRNSEMTIYINKQGKVIAMTPGGSSLSAGEKK